MTNMPMEIVEELSSMEELIDQADRRRQAEQDMRVPVGAEISRQNLGGASIVETKQDSLVRTAGGAMLPGRTPVYYRLGSNSIRYVDTGRLAHHLSKRVNGERVFSLKPWPNLSEPVVYEKTCDLCLNGPQPVRKRFVADENGDGETKYISHMTNFHGMQWQTILRQQERDERREEQALLREMLATIAGKNGSPTAADIETLVQERLAALNRKDKREAKPKAEATIPCSVCGQMFKNQNGLRLHGVKHKDS